MSAGAILDVKGLAKTFKKPFTGKKVEAVRGVSFDVKAREIFGFLGPNGAGKTTTIKMLTGLIAPTRGTATIFGIKAPSPEAMGRVGFLPENPYVYAYLTPREFVTLCARLNGVGGAGLTKKVEAILERTGVAYAMDRAVRTMSKGMLQRVGLAAALVHEPELLILDEPMSGLDPLGRKEVRDIILAERKAGRTVFFSTHILTDVEMMCDRVCILKKGEVVVAGSIADLLGDAGQRRFEVTLSAINEALAKDLAAMGIAHHEIGTGVGFEIEGDERLKDVLGKVLASGARLNGVLPKRESLEDLFVRRAI
jgi:ABC-2 type transport system ATP-binding protein